uniref:XK-related protein n=1 Tax=Strigamia maritima TaxID=126957 RepID=T1IQS9_STRMM
MTTTVDTLSKKEYDDNTISKKEYDDNTISKKEYDDNTISKKEYDDNTISKKEYDDNTISKKEYDDNTISKKEYDDNTSEETTDEETDDENKNNSKKAKKTKKHEVKEYTYWDLLFDIIRIFLFYVDYVFDTILVVVYLDTNDNISASLTLTFVLGPGVFISIFSMVWYCSSDAIEAVSPLPWTIWALRIISHLFLMAQPWRDIESMHFGLKYIRNPDSAYKIYRDKFQATTSLLIVLEAFLESAPQLVLQLVLIFRQKNINGFLREKLAHAFNVTKMEQKIRSSRNSSQFQHEGISDLANFGLNEEQQFAVGIVSICVSYTLIVQAITSYASSNELMSTFGSPKWYRSKDAIEPVSPVPPIMWKLRIIFHLLLMSQPCRDIESVHFGCRNIRNPYSEYKTYRIKFKTTTSLLIVLEAFLESAPQLILQLCILLKELHLNIVIKK